MTLRSQVFIIFDEFFPVLRSAMKEREFKNKYVSALILFCNIVTSAWKSDSHSQRSLVNFFLIIERDVYENHNS